MQAVVALALSISILVLGASAAGAPKQAAAPQGAAPRLAFSVSTLLDASDVEWPRAVAVDRDGNVYVAGETSSLDLPVTPDAHRRAPAGATDGFLAKLSPDGSQLLYATYFGGSDADAILAIALDGEGGVYVCGSTASVDLETPGGFHRHAPGGVYDGFVARFDDDGRTLGYASYVGGERYDVATGVEVVRPGLVAVAGTTFSENFETTASAFQRRAPAGIAMGSAFVATIDTTSSGAGSLAYATYFGGDDDQQRIHLTNTRDVAVDAEGRVYVCGSTGIGGFPVTKGAIKREGPAPGKMDGFVGVLDPKVAGAAGLVYASYVGGALDDRCTTLATSDAGVVVAGSTTSIDFPTTRRAFQPDAPEGGAGDYDGFVLSLDPSRENALVYSTYLGGSTIDQIWGVAVDAEGKALLTGDTSSSDFPLAREIEAMPKRGAAFVARLSADGSALDLSTAFGDFSETGMAVAPSAGGGIVALVWSHARGVPTTPNAYQRTAAEGGLSGAAVVVRVDEVGLTCDFAMRDVAVTANATNGDEAGAIVDLDGGLSCAAAPVEFVPESGSFFGEGERFALAYVATPEGITSIRPFGVTVTIPYDTCFTTDAGVTFRAVTSASSPVRGAWEVGELARRRYSGVADVFESSEGVTTFEERTHEDVAFRAKLKRRTRRMTVRLSEPVSIRMRGVASDCSGAP